MQILPINAPAAAQPSGGYVQALEVRDVRRLLVISGQIPETLEGHVPSDFGDQARLVWANILAQLEAANMTVANLVKVTTFLASRDHRSLNGAIRREILGSHTPALTIIITGIYDESWLLEIEAMAAE